MMQVAVMIRLAPWLRVYMAVFASVWCGLLAVGAIALAVQGEVAALIPLAMLAIGGPIIYLGTRLSVESKGDMLVVRNRLRTHTLSRADIEGFRLGGAMPFGKAVHVHLADGGLFPLDVTLTAGLLGRGRDRQQEQLRSLQRWHDRSSQ